MSRRRGQAYAQDLRDRVLAAVGEPIRAVAARLGVSPSYVSKVHSRCRKTGETTPGPQHNHVAPRLAPLYDALRARVAEQADATIAELRGWVKREHGIVVSHPVMWSTLARLGRQSRRSLLPGLEQAAGAALDHQVHRPARLGAWVLIRESWYKLASMR